MKFMKSISKGGSHLSSTYNVKQTVLVREAFADAEAFAKEK